MQSVCALTQEDAVRKGVICLRSRPCSLAPTLLLSGIHIGCILAPFALIWPSSCTFQDGEVDPADVHVDGVPTIEEERQMEEEKRC